MKKLVFLVLIFINLSPLLAKEGDQSIDSIINVVNLNTEKINNIENNLNGLSSDIQHIEYVVSQQKEIISQEQSAIENSFSSSSRLLEIFGIIIGVLGLFLTIGGIFLGLFISNKEKSVRILLKKVENINKDVTKTSNHINQLNDEINNNIDSLYSRLRQEETTTLLKRLIEVPLDIVNITQLLLSRTLRKEDFPLLLEAYNKLQLELTNFNEKDILPDSYKVNYLLQFFQHFCGESIETENLREDIIKFFPQGLNCAFPSDVRNSLHSLLNALNRLDLGSLKEDILLKFILGLNNSRNKNYTEAYNIIIEKSESINLENVWMKLIDKKVIIEVFGDLLCKKYKEDENFIKSVRKQITEHKKEGEN